MQNISDFSSIPTALSRMYAITALQNTAEAMLANGQIVDNDIITSLSKNLPAITQNEEGVTAQERVALARGYIKLAGTLAVNETNPQEREKLIGALNSFALECLNWISQDDPSISREFSILMHDRLGV